MSQLTETATPAVHPLVAALLAVTPQWDGEVITGTKTEHTVYGPSEPRDVCMRSGEPLVPDDYEVPVFGEAEPVAVVQVATVLRWASRDLGLVLCAHDAAKLDELADRIDPSPTAAVHTEETRP